jgi:distribution and morphology protein 34
MSRAPSSATSYTFHGTTTRNGRPRKAKKRVIDLRKKRDAEDTPSEAGTESTTPEPSIAPSSAPSVIYEERDGDVVTPPRTPRDARFGRRRASSVGKSPDATPRASIVLPNKPFKEESRTTQPPAYTPPEGKVVFENKTPKRRPAPLNSTRTYPANAALSSSSITQAQAPSLLRTLSTDKMAFNHGATGLYSPSEGSNGGILEQAWMMKMAKEIAKKVHEVQSKEERKWEENNRGTRPSSSGKRREAEAEARSEDGLTDAPPAYAF